jgi:hypothetical protein
MWLGSRGRGRKVFFFEKKKQKTFDCPGGPLESTAKSQKFLVPFFKKETRS